MSSPFKNDNELTVKEIWKEFGRKISIRKIYLLIEKGELKPAFRYAGARGTCVPREAVMEYKNRCLIDAGA